MKIKTITVSFFVFLFVLVGNANAFSFKLPNAGLTPESPFYFMDKALERVGDFFTFGEENKVRRKLSISEERIAELKELVEDGSEKVKEAFSNYEKEIEIFFEDTELGVELLEKIASSTARHRLVFEDLEDLFFKNQTSSTISKILERTQKAKEKSLQIHERYVKLLAKKDPEKAVNVFSNTIQNRLKNLEKKAEVEIEKNYEKLQKRIQEHVEYENFGNQISEIAKGLKSGDTTVKELIEKARAKHAEVLERVRERVEEKDSNSN